MKPNAGPSELDHPRDLLPWFVNGSLGGEELRAVDEHLRSCLACRREVEELREIRRDVKIAADVSPPRADGLERLLAEVESDAPRADRQRRRGGFSRWLPLLAAALAVAVGVGFWQENRPSPAVERAGEENAVLWSLVDENEPLPRAAAVLKWRTAPGWQDARFSVAVTEQGLNPVAEAHGLAAMEYRVPAESLADLPAGARLLWRIEAVRPDGTRRTELFRVRLE